MQDLAVLACSALLAVTVAAHFAFIGYVVTGGFLAWRWPRTIYLHVAAAAWGGLGLALGLPCPLTAVERWARERTGMPAMPPEGFIAHYLTGVVYPADAAVVVQALVFGLVATSWAVVIRRWHDGDIRLVPDRRGAR